MKSKSDAENHKKSRLIAEKVYCRDESRQMPNIAICRGKRQLSRFRTHRDKLLPLVENEDRYEIYVLFVFCEFFLSTFGLLQVTIHDGLFR